MRNILVYLGGIAVLVVVAVGLYQWLGSPTVTVSTDQAAAPASPPAAKGDASKVRADDFVMGSPDAPVTVIEYASLTCPHCAHFNNTVLGKLKSEYVKTGKVRWVYRDFPLNQPALYASALARCAGHERFFGFVDLLFKRQEQWAFGKDPLKGLAHVAALGGLTQKDIDTCFKDTKILKEIAAQRQEAADKFGVNATPTFIINGRKFEGDNSYEAFTAAIEAQLPKADK